LRAATGKIVAYIDSDADADPDWLSHVATTYRKFDVVGVGGPNFVPAEDNWIAKCVYRSPGGPTQVMLDDREAEHIPGCNMTFLKAALDEVGGFDPQFRNAADDVDICWRMLDKGWKIGFGPSAVVWHHRRPSVKAYWRQQVGYGVSESLLERKYPNKFNPWGHTHWAGRIYAPYPFFRLLSSPVIYQGLWGSAPFQPMYEPHGAAHFLTFLPRAMEWHVALAGLFVLGVFSPLALAAFGVGVAYTIFYCAHCAANAKLDVLIATEANPGWGKRLKWRALIAALNFLEPVARDWGRLKGGLVPWRSVRPGPEANRRTSPWWRRLAPIPREVCWSQPGTMQLEKFAFLNLMSSKLGAVGCFVGWNPTTEGWDLKVGRGALVASNVSAVVEHHGGVKRTAKMRAILRQPSSIRWTLISMAAVAVLLEMAGYGLAAGVTAILLAVIWTATVRELDQLESVLLVTADEVAADLMGIIPDHSLPAEEDSARESGCTGEQVKGRVASEIAPYLGSMATQSVLQPITDTSQNLHSSIEPVLALFLGGRAASRLIRHVEDAALIRT